MLIMQLFGQQMEWKTRQTVVRVPKAFNKRPFSWNRRQCIFHLVPSDDFVSETLHLLLLAPFGTGTPSESTWITSGMDFVHRKSIQCRRFPSKFALLSALFTKRPRVAAACLASVKCLPFEEFAPITRWYRGVGGSAMITLVPIHALAFLYLVKEILSIFDLSKPIGVRVKVLFVARWSIA